MPDGPYGVLHFSPRPSTTRDDAFEDAVENYLRTVAGFANAQIERSRAFPMPAPSNLAADHYRPDFLVHVQNVVRLAVVDAKRRKVLTKRDVEKLVDYRGATAAQRAIVVVPHIDGQPPCRVQRGALTLAAAESVEIVRLAWTDPAEQPTSLSRSGKTSPTPGVKRATARPRKRITETAGNGATAKLKRRTNGRGGK